MDVVKKQQQIQEFKDSLKGKTVDELKQIEQDIIKEADALDEKIKETSFELPEKGYENVARAIQTLLNKQSVNWQYALAYIAMFDFWNPEKKADTVAYAMLDSTLRIFGQMEFKGYEEWVAVAAVNKYFEPLQEKYSELTEKVYDIASRHNTVMEALGLTTPIES